MKSPGHSRTAPHPGTPENPRPLGPVFRVGIASQTMEYVRNDRRYFEWQVSEQDQALSGLAHWASLPTSVRKESFGEVGRIELPSSLRSASSALGGIEAFEGEKDAIVGFMVGYGKAVYEHFRAVDTNLLLDTVGVSRGNAEILMVPPHNLETNPDTIADWYSHLQFDIETVLEGDPQKDALINSFREGMSFLGVTQ